VVLADAAPPELHHEYVTDRSDALALGRDGQVVVAVPARLFRRIGNQLEDAFGARHDLTARAHHASATALTGALRIQ
jgi:hypothetical protein